jgi:hypothetical protein
LSCVGDHILQEFNTLYLTRFRTYEIVRPPQTKTYQGKGDLRQINTSLYRSIILDDDISFYAPASVPSSFFLPYLTYIFCSGGFRQANLSSVFQLVSGVPYISILGPLPPHFHIFSSYTLLNLLHPQPSPTPTLIYFKYSLSTEYTQSGNCHFLAYIPSLG